jgi:hypothetical protein
VRIIPQLRTPVVAHHIRDARVASAEGIADVGLLGEERNGVSY